MGFAKIEVPARRLGHHDIELPQRWKIRSNRNERNEPGPRVRRTTPLHPPREIPAVAPAKDVQPGPQTPNLRMRLSQVFQNELAPSAPVGFEKTGALLAN